MAKRAEFSGWLLRRFGIIWRAFCGAVSRSSSGNYAYEFPFLGTANGLGLARVTRQTEFQELRNKRHFLFLWSEKRSIFCEMKWPENFGNLLVSLFHASGPSIPQNAWLCIYELQYPKNWDSYFPVTLYKLHVRRRSLSGYALHAVGERPMRRNWFGSLGEEWNGGCGRRDQCPNYASLTAIRREKPLQDIHTGT